VFAPRYFEVSFSDNGVNFDHLTRSETPEKLLEKGNYTDKLSLALQQKSRYLKIRIKGIGEIPENFSGEGNPGWFFIDEIIIE
jgi:hexosaminidase